MLGWLGRPAEAPGGTLRVEHYDVIGNVDHVVALVNVRAGSAARRGGQGRIATAVAGADDSFGAGPFFMFAQAPSTEVGGVGG
jgi:hypothetical protein